MTKTVERAPYGTFHGAGLGDGEPRIISYSASSDGRFVVTVAVRTAEALTEYWRGVATGSLRTAAVVLVLVRGIWLFVRQLRVRERLAVVVQDRKRGGWGKGG